MGRRRGKKTIFLHQGTLEEEARLDNHSDDEPGLHVGGAVIYRAPLSTRTAARLPSGLGLPGCRQADARIQGPAQLQQQNGAASWCDRSDNSLDDELQDYLDNIEQHPDDSNQAGSSSSGAEPAGDDAAEAAEAAVQQLDCSPMAAVAATAGRTTRRGSLDADPLLHSHLGLGYHPGLGFKSTTAAARFSAVDLDDTLEEELDWDMAAGQQDDPNSSSDTDRGSGSDSDTISDSSRELDNEGTWHGGLEPADLDPAATAVVDAQGRPFALLEELTLQQRFPVLTRQQQQGSTGTGPEGAARRPTSCRSRSRQGGKQQTYSRQSTRGAATKDSSGVETFMSRNRMPSFCSAVTATAAEAACVAAVAAAGSAAAVRQQERRQQQLSVKGARGGQLLPGEKKKLRREKIAAKRAVRQAEAGASALETLAVVEEFVAGGGDMTVLPPMSKQKQAFTRALASLYGVKASSSGSGKSSIVLQSTSIMSLLNEDDIQGSAQLEALLTTEIAQELTAAAVAAGPAPRAQHKIRKGRPSQQAGRQHQGSRGAPGDGTPSVFQQPMMFVLGGIMDPNSVQHEPAAVEAAQTQAGTSAISNTAIGTDAQCILMTEQQLVVGEAAATAAAAVAAAVATRGADDGPNISKANAEAGSILHESSLVGSNEQQLAGIVLPIQHHYSHAEQQQSQQSELTCGAWTIDRQPHFAAVELEPSAAVTAGVDAPMYDRAPLGLGCSSCELGYGQNPSVASSPTDEAGPSDRCHSSGKHSSSHKGSRELQELEDKFSNLKAVTNPHAARRQQRRQHHEQQVSGRHHDQQRQEQRLRNPNTALGPAAGSSMATRSPASADIWSDGNPGTAGDEQCHVTLTLGLTAQQVKKAKKQQLRNQRRESRAAIAAGDMQVTTELIASGVDAGSGSVANSFAAFEAHTTGIGSRLLGRWGWSEGQGLGRARHGRAEPLQAARRPRQLGLGAE